MHFFYFSYCSEIQIKLFAKRGFQIDVEMVAVLWGRHFIFNEEAYIKETLVDKSKNDFI